MVLLFNNKESEIDKNLLDKIEKEVLISIAATQLCTVKRLRELSQSDC